MPVATYLEDELNQKVPQRIIKDFQKYDLLRKNEKVFAVAGCLMAIFGWSMSSIVVVEDRIIIQRIGGVTEKSARFTVSFLDFSGFESKQVPLGYDLYIRKSDGESIHTCVVLSEEHLNKLLTFINSYKAQGVLNAEGVKERGDSTEINIRYEKYEKQREKALKDNLKCIHKFYYKMNYCGCSDANIVSSPADITVDAIDRIMKIEPQQYPAIEILLNDIQGAYITADTHIPENDMVHDYTFYLHIKYKNSGRDSEIILSHKQKQYGVIDHLQDLCYLMRHIDELIVSADSRNEHYDQKLQKLASERETILANRASSIEKMKNLLTQNPGINDNIHGNNMGGVQPTTFSTPSPAAFSPADELRKYKSLLDDGIITQEDFDAKKKQLLGL